MNHTTFSILTKAFTGSTETTIPIECDTSDYYIIGLTLLTTGVAFVSEVMSLSKCKSNGIIELIKKCASQYSGGKSKEKEDDEEDEIEVEIDM